MSTSPRRLGLYVPWALFALFCLCWTGYWFYAKDAAVKALDAQIARVNAAGVKASYFRARADGYPLRLTLTLENFGVSTPEFGLSASSLPVSVNLSNPRHIIVGFGDDLRWRTGNFLRQWITVRRGQMSLRFDSANALARFSLELDDAHIQGVYDGYRVPNETKFDKLLVHVRPDPRRDQDAQVVIEANNWSGPTPFAALNGLSPFAHFRAAVAVTDYATLGTAQPLRTWTGALRVERLDVDYADRQVTGDGALDLDGLYRPVGTLTLTPAGGEPVALVAAEGWWTFAGLRVAPAKPLYAPSPPD